MILKGSQRGNGQNLAAHLMRIDDNEHVNIHELRGFSADDLHGAFKEAEAVSRGTKCRQYLFSLSLNPPSGKVVSLEAFNQAIDRVEERLGLTGQPRAIVGHEKDGRSHIHCVWSRIDADTMTARPLPFFKNRMMEISKSLYLEHGWDMPRGMLDTAKRDPTNFTLAEWQQAKRQGVDPRWTKQLVQDCWSRSDSGTTFDRALREYGFRLGRGDRRSFVLVDHEGGIQSLSRTLGMTAKQMRGRLGDGINLPDVGKLQREIGVRMSPTIRRHVDESRKRFAERSASLGELKQAMTREHRAERAALADRQGQRWIDETRTRAGRIPKGLRGLWHRLTGQYQKVRQQNEQEAQSTLNAQAAERAQLVDRQRSERASLQKSIVELRKNQASLLRDLRKDVGRYLNLSQNRGQSQTRVISRGLRLER
ncbi:relaxase/mobilization nuclease domain-containing protein [Mycoplana rhizolycopersici]|uniref:Relaxase n=1 Tax=Mycoplana rhizolycopersici TaxID=2746702 RepID=A0ABX2QFR3_9HYPH|nr:relaxase [Rhizobium rhizolycopersici]NVP56622.1 relaxase [Rhizobium rhizolycopersici]